MEDETYELRELIQAYKDYVKELLKTRKVINTLHNLQLRENEYDATEYNSRGRLYRFFHKFKIGKE